MALGSGSRGSALWVARGVLSFLSSLAASIVMIYGVARYNPILDDNYIIYDYLVWLATLLTSFSFYDELRRFGDPPVRSTFGLTLSGWILVVLGRALSLLFNDFDFVGYVGVPVGNFYTIRGFIATSLVLIGSFLMTLTTAFHLLVGGPCRLPPLFPSPLPIGSYPPGFRSFSIDALGEPRCCSY